MIRAWKSLDGYVDAFHRYDADEPASLLREDATFSMPSHALWLRGPEVVRGWLALLRPVPPDG